MRGFNARFPIWSKTLILSNIEQTFDQKFWEIIVLWGPDFRSQFWSIQDSTKQKFFG